MYAVSLLGYPFACKNPASGMQGIEVLLISPLGILGLEPRGYANFLYFIAIRCVFGGLQSEKVYILPGAASLAMLSIPIPAMGCGLSGGAWSGQAAFLAPAGYLWVAAVLLGCYAYYRTPARGNAEPVVPDAIAEPDESTDSRR